MTIAAPPGMAPFRYPSDPLQFLAWRDFITFAMTSKEPDFWAAFTAETGRALLSPPTNGLDAMIDAATGARARIEAEVLPEFIEWLNVNAWGEDEVEWQPMPGAQVQGNAAAPAASRRSRI